MPFVRNHSNLISLKKFSNSSKPFRIYCTNDQRNYLSTFRRILFVTIIDGLVFHPVAGAIFTEDQKDSPSELAFKYAIYKINKDKTLLANTTLVYDIQYVPKDDSFRTSKKGTLPRYIFHDLSLKNYINILHSKYYTFTFKDYGKRNIINSI